MEILRYIGAIISFCIMLIFIGVWLYIMVEPAMVIAEGLIEALKVIFYVGLAVGILWGLNILLFGIWGD